MSKFYTPVAVDFTAYSDPQKTQERKDKKRGSISASIKKILASSGELRELLNPVNKENMMEMLKKYTVAEVMAFAIVHAAFEKKSLPLWQFIAERTDGKPIQAFIEDDTATERQALLDKQVADFFAREAAESIVDAEVVEVIEDKAAE